MSIVQEVAQTLGNPNETKCSVIVDLDETVFNPLFKWQEQIKARLGVSMTVEDIEDAGSLDNYFAHSSKYDEFVDIAQELRSDNALYTDVPLIEGAANGLDKINHLQHVYLAAYLTARPMSVIPATRNELLKHQLPIIPILARPEAIGFYSSSQWKLDVLLELRDGYPGILVMIDDNPEVADRIREENNKTPGRFIVSILFNGPLTRRHVSRNALQSIPDQHFYVSVWDQIPEICESYAWRFTAARERDQI